MSHEAQKDLMICPRSESWVQPNIAPVFIGPHRTFGLWIGSTLMDYRIMLACDDRDGNGFQPIIFPVYAIVNSLYDDMMSYGTPEQFLAFIVSRINDSGRMLPPATPDCLKVFCTGLETRTWPQPLPIPAYPTDEISAINWLPAKLSNMSWSVAKGFLELV